MLDNSSIPRKSSFQNSFAETLVFVPPCGLSWRGLPKKIILGRVELLASSGNVANQRFRDLNMCKTVGIFQRFY